MNERPTRATAASELLDAVAGFADPVVGGTVNAWTWNAAEQQRQPH
ncbi:hypothetical protein O1R50_13795 [Glycomyces luteolus]|uniref:Uncharacterized protein n=1 Tax=Glycomyces luteolus TaxID=2670330 RepID=A0A9X3PBX7_9ACTN|nr:hypothetical protein [Glycomyces luteolus]MDA1360698.1 hypothetical protein [Glycomyces luteolus]